MHMTSCESLNADAAFVGHTDCGQCFKREVVKSVERISDAILNALDKRSSFFARGLILSPYFP